MLLPVPIDASRGTKDPLEVGLLSSNPGDWRESGTGRLRLSGRNTLLMMLNNSSRRDAGLHAGWSVSRPQAQSPSISNDQKHP